eukprot:TRINITY_DN28386_c0_g1_i1.p1 TRINITY_DN28386_c0_g1~~TRINITY_DN28386_c0_g1_i1.p1  ORF type:complete len:275 (+),score=18.62 TRINITY_DN28386_c0_g1_i1:127-951(+)
MEVKCPRCTEPVYALERSEANQNYHQHCYTCNGCDVDFEANQANFTHEGEIYCRKCIEEFCPSFKCSYCGTDTWLDYIEFEKKKWCPCHFNCSEHNCGTTLSLETAHSYYGLPYCLHHFEINTGVKVAVESESHISLASEVELGSEEEDEGNLEGLLDKQGGSQGSLFGRFSWRARHFILCPNSLEYYKPAKDEVYTRESPNFKGAIDFKTAYGVANVKILESPPPKAPKNFFYFVMVTPLADSKVRRVILRASDVSVRQKWVNKIENFLQVLR